MGVQPPKSVLEMSAVAPASKSHWQRDRCPSPAAIWSGVHPARSTVEMSADAPTSNSHWHTGRWPQEALQNMGVSARPLNLVMSGAAPPWSWSHLHTPSSPNWHARSIGFMSCFRCLPIVIRCLLRRSQSAGKPTRASHARAVASSTASDFCFPDDENYDDDDDDDDDGDDDDDDDDDVEVLEEAMFASRSSRMYDEQYDKARREENDGL